MTVTTIYQTVLEAKVAAVNNANAEAMRLCAEARAAFAPYVGQEVERVDGQLLLKFVPLAPKATGNFLVYKKHSKHSLCWAIISNEIYQSKGYHSSVSHEQSFCIGNLSNGILKDVEQIPLLLRTDYTVDGIIAQRKIINKLKDEIIAQSNIINKLEDDLSIASWNLRPF